ncbi:EH domain-containing protein 2-like [Octopus sinensis]|uniref:EH domain-containing protein 2-like n=1 Tax=Octopus sinensis TaxID=2607531 RepID=A0A6P7TVE3_9MOLL|nr:EH domain-containing protein 2-like [Octopus sinensis]
MHCMGTISSTHLEQKPSVLFMGSYSSGKTSAIKYLLQIDIAELRVGPEPTTDIFHVLTYGEKQVTVGGIILMNDPHFGFQNFFPHNKDIARQFQLTRINNMCLKAMDIIDSPGFLSGDNMDVHRGYDLPGVLTELATRTTRIYMMMDVFKVDFSSECKDTLRQMRPMLGKMRLIFNKADYIDEVNLMRLYGAFIKSIDAVKFLLKNVVPNVLGKLNAILNEFDQDKIEGGVFGIVNASNKLIEKEVENSLCITAEHIEKADKIFATFQIVDGRADSAQIKPIMMESKLPYESLAKIWELSCNTFDGKMDIFEWRIASFLISHLTNGNVLPVTLPVNLRASSMRSEADSEN